MNPHRQKLMASKFPIDTVVVADGESKLEKVDVVKKVEKSKEKTNLQSSGSSQSAQSSKHVQPVQPVVMGAEEILTALQCEEYHNRLSSFFPDADGDEVEDKIKNSKNNKNNNNDNDDDDENYGNYDENDDDEDDDDENRKEDEEEKDGSSSGSGSGEESLEKEFNLWIMKLRNRLNENGEDYSDRFFIKGGSMRSTFDFFTVEHLIFSESTKFALANSGREFILFSDVYGDEVEDNRRIDEFIQLCKRRNVAARKLPTISYIKHPSSFMRDMADCYNINTGSEEFYRGTVLAIAVDRKI